jgi:hypothetical protein
LVMCVFWAHREGGRNQCECDTNRYLLPLPIRLSSMPLPRREG